MRERGCRSALGGSQHPLAPASALHSSSIRSTPSLVIGSVNCAFGTVRMLSREIAHSRSIPSSGPSGTSLTSPRMRAVTSATTTLRSPGIASSRVRTQTGRRPSTSSSSQKIAPRLTKALRGSPRGRSPRPSGPHAHRAPRPRALPPRRSTSPTQSGPRPRAVPRWPARRSTGEPPRAAFPLRSHPQRSDDHMDGGFGGVDPLSRTDFEIAAFRARDRPRTPAARLAAPPGLDPPATRVRGQCETCA